MHKRVVQLDVSNNMHDIRSYILLDKHKVQKILKSNVKVLILYCFS